MEEITFYIITPIITLALIILFVKKDKIYGNPKIAFWDLAYFMSWFLFLLPIRYPHEIFSSIHVYLLFMLGQFLLVSLLARHFIDKEKKKLNK